MTNPKKPGKEPRKDIRYDKRPIPQEHHSSRGAPPRNSGNVTRGSQLLNTQVLMWLQGARMPVFVWLGAFLLLHDYLVADARREQRTADCDANAVVPLPAARSAFCVAVMATSVTSYSALERNSLVMNVGRLIFMGMLLG